MTQAATIQPNATPTRAPIILALSDIKLHHSVFALPFAVLASFLATPATMPLELWLEPPPLHWTEAEVLASNEVAYAQARAAQWATFARQLALVVVCMFFARTWAMLVNRIADRRIDADNPRTQRRALASGALSLRAAVTTALASAAAFALACACFLLFFDNPWPLLLAIPTLLWIAFYSYTKRFTALCHVFLGGALAASPLAAAIAIDPASLGAHPSIWFLAGMVLCWVAGFDVLYALQDLDFDRESKLHSIPAALGATGAAWASRALHVIAIAFLITAAMTDHRLSAPFYAAIALVALLLIAEHAILIKRGLAGLPMAFFTINGIVSLILGAVGAIDVIY